MIDMGVEDLTMIQRLGLYVNNSGKFIVQRKNEHTVSAEEIPDLINSQSSVGKGGEKNASFGERQARESEERARPAVRNAWQAEGGSDS